MNQDRNLIIDARPILNAMSNRAMGAGTENMEHYASATRLMMGIENIHVMRESLYKVVQDLVVSPSLEYDQWL